MSDITEEIFFVPSRAAGDLGVDLPVKGPSDH
jgi:hypothetical protein